MTEEAHKTHKKRKSGKDDERETDFDPLNKSDGEGVFGMSTQSDEIQQN